MGVAVIHGVAFRQEDFKDMAANGVALVWSPSSNYELYGATTRIQAAKSAGSQSRSHRTGAPRAVRECCRSYSLWRIGINITRYFRTAS